MPLPASGAGPGVVANLPKALGQFCKKLSITQTTVTGTGRVTTGLVLVDTGSVQVTAVAPVMGSATIMSDDAVLVAFSGGAVDVGVVRFVGSGTSIETSGLAVNTLATGR